MHPFLMMILVPAVAALLAYVLGRLRAELSFIGSVLPLYFAVRLFLQSRHDVIVFTVLQRAGVQVAFRLDSLSGFVLLFTAIFGVLILLYSLRSMRGHPGARGFYVYSLLTLACAFGALLAANLLVLAFFWGCLLVLVYGLLLVSRGDGQPAATKALVIVGLSDFALLLGVALLVVRGGWIDLVPPVAMRLSEPSAILAFLLVAVGALAKAGSMPLHSWIPTASETSPATVMALVPASLDKLLGIYLLTRLSVYVFDISSNMTLRTVFMAVGSVTVLAAVIMALVQKRVMRLLAFHAVSQVGYMVIGIGTGVPVGIAGGLFHMLNNALYKTGLFLTAGSVYSQSKTDKIDELGGLAGKMPLTFATFLLCSLAIAGVPPLNGFVSKWMVYQGIIDTGLEGNRLYPVFLVAAMLGSVLTLASFLKLLHAIFLGQRPRQLEGAREVGFAMWLPSLLIALACVAFGVLAFPLALRPLIFPALPFVTELQGIWQPALASLLLLVGLGIGAVLYLLGTVRRPVTARTYVGGETLAEDEEGRVTGTAFYTPVKGLPVMGDLLRFGELGAFDLFNWVGALLRTIGQLARAFNRQLLDRLFWAVGALARYTGGGLSYVQNGFLPLYVAWVFVGAVILYVVVVLGR